MLLAFPELSKKLSVGLGMKKETTIKFVSQKELEQLTA